MTSIDWLIVIVDSLATLGVIYVGWRSKRWHDQADESLREARELHALAAMAEDEAHRTLMLTMRMTTKRSRAS